MSYQLITNMLIRYVNEDNRVERILWIDSSSNIVVVINIYNDDWPKFIELSGLVEQMKSRNIEILNEDPMVRIVREEDITEKDKSIRDRALKIISDMIDKIPEPQIFIMTERRKMLKELTKEFNISRNSINGYLKKYWKRGKTPNTLIPDYYKCGGSSTEKKAGNVKRGRPRIFVKELGEGVNVDESIKKIFRIAVNRYYNTSKKNSLVTAYELMLRDFFYDDFKIQDGVKIPILKNKEEIPTIEQFRYWFNKERNLKKEVTLRNSAKKYQQQHRAILGSSSFEALGPASIYEIDATVADVYLVSRYNRNWIIGRPVIYTIIDRFSREIVGLNISLEGPSWLGSLVALANAMSDKVEFCKEYGIIISQDMWNTKYLCDTLIADRGEVEGYNIHNLVKNLGIKVENTPSFRADWKPFVEQYFRLINLRVKPLLPGVIDEDFRLNSRNGKDYRMDSRLDLYQFTQVIIKCALYFNNNRYLKGFNRTKLMIQDDIEPIPSNIWSWGVKNVAGKLRTLPEDIIKLNLLPQSKAVITEKGIRFKGVLYGSEKALRGGWFEEARNNGHFRITVSYDPRNLNFIYIITDKGMNFEKCFLLKHQERYIDRTVEEIEYLLQKESLEIKSGSSNELQAKVDLFSEIEDIVKKAESLTNSVQDISASKASKIRDIRANRGIEKSINRAEQAYELGKRKEKLGEIIDFENKNETYEVISDMDILKQRQKQRREKFNE